MPIRSVKPRSDRGNIKDIQNGDESNLPPTSFELRIKELYEKASANKDESLIESLGLITINGSPTDPVSVFKHREYVNSLSKKLANKIERARGELDIYFESSYDIKEMRISNYKQANSRNVILSGAGDIIKRAWSKAWKAVPLFSRSFRRASES
jgi:hypothetical protein